MKGLKLLKRRRGKKTLFLIIGFINVLITNIIIQILLVFFSIIISTFVGQLFNFLFGFFLYGKKVFGLKILNQFHLYKYIFLNIFIWNLNWILISNLNYVGFSKNILALFIMPPLALISYVCQKKIVFTKKYF